MFQKLDFGLGSNMGLVRTNNEDCAVIMFSKETLLEVGQKDEFLVVHRTGHPLDSRKLILMAVADGMGGELAGELASRLAIDCIKKYWLDNYDKLVEGGNVESFLTNCTLEANKQIISHSKIHPEVSGMGTTIILALISEIECSIAWVGDSRAYLMGHSGHLCLKTKDHSLVQELVDNKEITYEQSFYHPDNHILTQSLGVKNRKLAPGFLQFELKRNDVLLLCSDGLNGVLPDSEIEARMRACTSFNEIGIELIKASCEAGGTDNITLGLFRFSGQYQVPAIKQPDRLPGTVPKTKRKSVIILNAIKTTSLIVFVILVITLNLTQKSKESSKEVDNFNAHQPKDFNSSLFGKTGQSDSLIPDPGAGSYVTISSISFSNKNKMDTLCQELALLGYFVVVQQVDTFLRVGIKLQPGLSLSDVIAKFQGEHHPVAVKYRLKTKEFYIRKDYKDSQTPSK